MIEGKALGIYEAASGARRRRLATLPPAAVLIVLALLVAALNPIGFVGGGGDDWHYLQAAGCWAVSGPCLPHDHWTARWPLIAPMAVALGLFGESRVVVSLVPFLFASAVLILFAEIAERLFGRTAALAAGVAVLLTPALSLFLLRPNIDLVELAFLLGALAATLSALSSRRRAIAALAGGSLALAVLSRETSVVFVAIAGLWFLAAPARDKKLLAWAVPGFALPILAEMLTFWAATGNPLHRLKLAFGHSRIPSTELAADVDMTRSPILNPDFIAGWKPASGIEAHWIVKPVLNLVMHPEMGFTLIAAILLLVAFRRESFVPRETVRWSVRLLASAALAALLLAYVLAIDPKPRMFLPLACAAAATIGALAPRAWAAGHRVLPLLVCLMLGRGLLVLAGAPSVVQAEAVAAQWIASAPAATLDETTRRHFALVPGLRALPVEDPTRLLRLEARQGVCTPRANERVSRSWSFADGEAGHTRLARRAGLIAPERDTHSLCLFRRS